MRCPVLPSLTELSKTLVKHDTESRLSARETERKSEREREKEREVK